jgi:hypothetical protein
MQVEETGTTQPVAGIIYPPPDVRRKVTDSITRKVFN